MNLIKSKNTYFIITKIYKFHHKKEQLTRLFDKVFINVQIKC